MRRRPGRTIRSILGAVGVSAVVAGCGTLPDATFSISPDGPYKVGDELTFEYGVKCTSLSDVQVYWDTDGNGSFERGGRCNVPANATVKQRYANPGRYRVALHAVHQVFGLGAFNFFTGTEDYSYKQVDIAAAPVPGGNTPPVADFSATPNPAYTEREIVLDASASRDPDGRIVSYEWDRDGDGTYDATGVTTKTTPDRAGTREVRLRVTDDGGAKATKELAIPVIDGVPPERSLSQAGPAVAARAVRFSTTLGGRVTSKGKRFMSGTALTGTGIRARGTMRLRGMPAPLRGKRGARWAANLTSKQTGSRRRAKLSLAGYLLLDLKRGDRVCLNGRVSGSPGKTFSGRLAVVGGTGKGRRVRGTARLRVPTSGRKPQARGSLNLVRSKKARGLPRPCRSLTRSLR